VRHTACWALGELARNGEAELVQTLHRETQRANDPVTRAVAWAGLAKAGVALSQAEIEEAAEAVTSYPELVILGIAAAECGCLSVLAKALHASQANHAPIWRLEGQLCQDYRAALQRRGEPGRILLEFWKRGDLD
jgi:hypothetical protein